jgi:hypothetical protein
MIIGFWIEPLTSEYSFSAMKNLCRNWENDKNVKILKVLLILQKGVNLMI